MVAVFVVAVVAVEFATSGLLAGGVVAMEKFCNWRMVLSIIKIFVVFEDV